MKAFLEILFQTQSLTQLQAESAMNLILEGKCSNEQVAAFLGALQAKKESIDELLGFLTAIKKKSILVPLEGIDAVDVCGTGGDNSGSFNISTTVAFVVAGGGVPVVKH